MINRSDAICQPHRGIDQQDSRCRVSLEPPQVASMLPSSAKIIDVFTGASGNSFAPGCGEVVLLVAYELALHHERQWRAEEVSRKSGASADDVAASKRLIDDLNTRRVALVEQVDTWTAQGIRGNAAASLHTETLGSVIDRMAIAWVRSRHLASSADGCVAFQQFAELASAYDDLIGDVTAGRRRLPAWRPLKRYRDAS
jgi:hypothetical protein